MKTETFKGSMENAYGKTLPQKLDFSGSFEAYTLPDSVKDTTITFDTPEGADSFGKDDVVTYGELYAFVNGKRKAAARQKAMNAVLEANGIEKPTLEDPQVQLATIIKALVAGGRSKEAAITLAETTLGVKFNG